MNRVAFFIDGFNLYHSLKQNAPDCRWLNLRKLCEQYIDTSKETLINVYYFSAVAYWHPDKEKIQRHQKYIARLRQENVIPILGVFKEKDIKCRLCKQSFKSHEEKRTDVNIALTIVSEAIQNHFDTGIIVSGDTDMIPAIETVRNLSLGKRIGVLFPMKRFTNEMKSYADFTLKITRKELLCSLFESETAPDGWVPEE